MDSGLDDQVRLDSVVELEFYRLQHVSDGAIALADGATVKGATDVGTGHLEEDDAPLSEIIAKLNDRFSTAFTDTDRLFLEQLQQDGANDEEISETVLANTFEKFDLAVRQLLPKLMIGRLAGNDEMVRRCFDNADFQEIIYDGLSRGIYETVMSQQNQPR